MKQITFRQYRRIDLTLLCVLTAIFETVASLATNKWFVLQAMAVSITLMMTCLTMLRWGWQAILPSIIGAFAYCTASGGSIKQYIIYCGGALFCILSLPLLKRIGKEKVRNDFVMRSVFAITTYLCVTVGRWLVSLIFEPTLSTLLPFITTDVLSLLFAVLVLSLGKSMDGLTEDQKSYLLRLDRERKEVENENLNDSF